MPPESSEFPHRCNADFTFDSICHQCFQTIATVRDEADLLSFERKHVCDPLRVRRFGRGIVQPRNLCNKVQVGNFCMPIPEADAGFVNRV